MVRKERQRRRPDKAQKITRPDRLLPAPEPSARCYDCGWVPPKKAMTKDEVEGVIRRGNVSSLVRVLDKGTVEEAENYRKAGIVELPEDLQQGLVGALYKKRGLQRVLGNLKIYGAAIAGISALVAGCLVHVSGGNSGALAMSGIILLILGHITRLKKETTNRDWCWQTMQLLYGGRSWAESTKEMLERMLHGKTTQRRLHLPSGKPKEPMRVLCGMSSVEGDTTLIVREPNKAEAAEIEEALAHEEHGPQTGEEPGNA